MTTTYSDAEQADAYDRICQIAREYALILSAAGGVVTIVHPETQRSEGVRDHIQWLHGLGKHPKSIAREKEDARQQVEHEAPAAAEKQPELF